MARLLDVEVVQLQPPYHGRRTPRGARFGGELYWTADLVRSIEALRQNLLDARTLLGWLLAEDPRPVGVMGLSLGGALTLALTCLDERFAFSIPLIAHMDLAAMVADAPVLREHAARAAQFGWGIDEFRRFVADIGWYDLAPKLPPEPHPPLRGVGRPLLRSGRRRGDVAALGAAGDPLVPRQPHGLPHRTCPTRWRKSVASSMNGPAGALTNVDPPAPGWSTALGPHPVVVRASPCYGREP